MSSWDHVAASAAQRHSPLRARRSCRLRDAREMAFVASFVARVREQLMANDHAKEFEKIVAIKSSPLASYIVIRRAPRDCADVSSKRLAGRKTEYAVDRCVKISPWRSVLEQGSLAAHFRKPDAEAKEPSRVRQQGKLGDPKKLSQGGRTTVDLITIREWSQESQASVKEMWHMLNSAAKRNTAGSSLKEQHANLKSVVSKLGTSAVDSVTRMKERNRSGVHRQSVRITAPARISRGQAALHATRLKSQQTSGRYSALGRGATGDKSFARQLVGAPNLDSFNSKEKTYNRKLPSRDVNYGSTNSQPGLHTQSQPGYREENMVRTCLLKSSEKRRTSPPAGSGRVSHDALGCPKSLAERSNATVKLGKRAIAEVVVSTPDSDENDRAKSRSKRPPRHSVLSARADLDTKTVAASAPALESQLSNQFSNGAGGITNDGNTCYLNAVIQVLTSEEMFIANIRKQISPEFSDKTLSAALLALVERKASAKTLDAKSIREVVASHFPQFSTTEQQDAHEFFLQCLHLVAKECAFTDFSDSPTHTRFTLVQDRNLRCISCGHTSTRSESLRGLSLDIPEEKVDEAVERNLNIEDLLANFFSSQELDLSCERCAGKKAVAQTHVAFPPHSLILHVKRVGIVYTPSNGGVTLTKVSERVSIPDEVSLTPFLSETALPPETLFCKKGSDYGDTKEPVGKKAVKNGAKLRQLVSNSSSRANHSGRDFAGRFRVHATKPPSTENCASCGNRGSGYQAVCRRCEPEDIIEECEFTQGANGVKADLTEMQIESIMEAGLPRRDAERILHKANFDKILALGMAVDLRRRAKDYPNDFDNDLLEYLSLVRGSMVNARGPKNIEARYTLTAVIRHDSPSAERGHYVADVRKADGSWCCYNDSTVTRLESRELQTTEGYMCLYTLT